ncbi:MAG: hypothetical protein NZ869_09830, partial [Thermoanaerobaculum sp.]|nr:hypothetical protein [Thermoanaerobaculum sp.]MDW7967137.1 hypothetical protein [Thermoanaerobaculum sp.]
IIWHGYFVHLRHFNKAMFTGYLEESEYAREHPLELEQIRRGEQPAFAPITTVRLILFALLALALVGGSAMLFIWLRWTPMAG